MRFPLAFLTAAVFAAPAPAQVNALISSASGIGTVYSISARYNNHNSYVHLANSDVNGYLVWEADYDPGYDAKPVYLMAADDGAFILAENRVNGLRAFELLRYDAQGYMTWRAGYSDTLNNIPVTMAVDYSGNVYAACNVREDGHYYAALWKYDGRGVLAWRARYSGGNNTYAHQVLPLFNGNMSFGVSVFGGTEAAGQYERRSITYDQFGNEQP
ncbi:MAG: hypothetical protein WC421_09765 [Elusimicrobiales bacterium]